MTVKIKPLGNRIAVQALEVEEKTQGGIYIATKSEEKVLSGKVMAVGEGKLVDGKVIPMALKGGETVVFNQYSATEVECAGEKYWVVREEDVLAVIA